MPAAQAALVRGAFDKKARARGDRPRVGQRTCAENKRASEKARTLSGAPLVQAIGREFEKSAENLDEVQMYVPSQNAATYSSQGLAACEGPAEPCKAR